MRQEKLRCLLALEQQHLDRCLEQYFGYYLLLLGDRHRKRVAQSPVQKHFVIKNNVHIIGGDVVSEYQAMPFAPNSVDVIVLLHALEHTKDPDSLLAEMYRLLRQDGHLIVVGFNPWRPAGKNAARALYGDEWVKRYTCSNIASRLNKLDFTVTQRQYYGFCLSKHVAIKSRCERFFRLLCSSLGIGYWLIAEKKTSTLTPLLSPSWVSPVVVLAPKVTPTNMTKKLKTDE